MRAFGWIPFKSAPVEPPTKSLPTLSKWDKRFLSLCNHCKLWSKDPSTQVCAVIVEGKNREISRGFNGFPKGIRDDLRLTKRDIKCLITIHAELNAILFAQRDLTGCTIYSSQFPCARCASVIIQVGITRVVAYKGKYTDAEKESSLAKQNFDEAGVKWVEI